MFKKSGVMLFQIILEVLFFIILVFSLFFTQFFTIFPENALNSSDYSAHLNRFAQIPGTCAVVSLCVIAVT